MQFSNLRQWVLGLRFLIEKNLPSVRDHMRIIKFRNTINIKVKFWLIFTY